MSEDQPATTASDEHKGHAAATASSTDAVEENADPGVVGLQVASSHFAVHTHTQTPKTHTTWTQHELATTWTLWYTRKGPRCCFILFCFVYFVLILG